MVVVQIVVFAGGAALALWTLLAALRTVVLPRGDPVILNRVIFRTTRVLFRLVANERRSFSARDRVMALYAPVSLALLPAVWVILVMSGYMAMFWSLGGRSWSEAFFVSGSSLLTLGFASVATTFQRVLAFSEATIGLGLVALLITFLPAMYSAFSRRETEVSLLEVRAGEPPTAIEFLTRAHRIGWLEDLADTWARWEVWFTDIEESHTTYPALTFLRSPRPERSWVTASGAVLDSASLLLSTVDIPWQPQAALTIRAGYLSLRRVAGFFGIPFDPDPAPTDPISITRREYDQAWDRLAEVGVPLKPDRDRAWLDYAGWRVNYDSVLLDLAELTMAPYAPWSADRSTPNHSEPRLRSWGRGFTR